MPFLPPDVETLFGLPVPSQVCGMERGELTDYEVTSPGLGYSVAYGSGDAQLTLYVYDAGEYDIPSDLRSTVATKRFGSELSEILGGSARPDDAVVLRKTFALTTVAQAGPDFLGAIFNGADARGTYDSFFLFGAKDQKFIKLRGTSRAGTEQFDKWLLAVANSYVGLLWPERIEQSRGSEVQLPGGAIEETLDSLTHAAERGDPLAQVRLADRLFNGDGVASDLAKAAHWTRRAAEQGNVGAQFNLGQVFAHGDGVEQDQAEAAKWFRLAANQGLVDAQFRMGIACAGGLGVPMDAEESVRWYRLAAEQGFPAAQTNLGYAYSNGVGVPQDSAAAMKWYRLAAQQGHIAAQQNLGEAYLAGRLVAVDEVKSAAWYRLAAEQGDAQAQNNLGVAYATGRGVAQDAAAAFLWFHRSAVAGNADAARNRERALSELTSAQVDELRRRFDPSLG